MNKITILPAVITMTKLDQMPMKCKICLDVVRLLIYLLINWLIDSFFLFVTSVYIGAMNAVRHFLRTNQWHRTRRSMYVRWKGAVNKTATEVPVVNSPNDRHEIRYVLDRFKFWNVFKFPYIINVFSVHFQFSAAKQSPAAQPHRREAIRLRHSILW